MSTRAQTNARWSPKSQKALAALQDRAMVKRTAPIRVISFFYWLLARRSARNR
jgi:hypothetical protein